MVEALAARKLGIRVAKERFTRLRMAFDGDDEVEVGGAEDGDIKHGCQRTGRDSVHRMGASSPRRSWRLEPVVASGCGSGAHTDGRDEPETGSVALVFGFSTPEAVFVLFAGEDHAVGTHGATRAYVFCCCFASLSRLWPFGRGREEQMREALTGPVAHPVIHSLDLHIEIDDGHSSAP